MSGDSAAHAAAARRPLEVADLLGCWKLVDAFEERDGVVLPNPYLGRNATGYLHYLAGGRVAVTVALAGRQPMSGSDRRKAPAAELAQSALTFDAYAGTFSLLGADRIAHHIEISTYQNQVGTDLVRRVVLEDGLLSLFPELPPDEHPRWLVWRRIAA